MLVFSSAIALCAAALHAPPPLHRALLASPRGACVRMADAPKEGSPVERVGDGGLKATLARLRDDYLQGYNNARAAFRSGQFKSPSVSQVVAQGGDDASSLANALAPAALAVLVAEAAQFVAALALCWLLRAPPPGSARWAAAAACALASRAHTRALRLCAECALLAAFRSALDKAHASRAGRLAAAREWAAQALAVAATALVLLRALDRSLLSTVDTPPLRAAWEALRGAAPAKCAATAAAFGRALSPATECLPLLRYAASGGPLRGVIDAATTGSEAAAERAVRAVWAALVRARHLLFV